MDIVRLLSAVFYDYRDRMDKSIKFCMDMLQDLLINIRRGATQNFFPLAKKTKWLYFYTFIELKYLFFYFMHILAWKNMENINQCVLNEI